jgi:hypothetical protein
MTSFVALRKLQSNIVLNAKFNATFLTLTSAGCN